MTDLHAQNQKTKRGPPHPQCEPQACSGWKGNIDVTGPVLGCVKGEQEVHTT